MLLLSPAGQTQHCTASSLCVLICFSSARKVNIIKNRCGRNRANSFSSVSELCLHAFLPTNNIQWVVNDNSAKIQAKPAGLPGNKLTAENGKYSFSNDTKRNKSKLSVKTHVGNKMILTDRNWSARWKKKIDSRWKMERVIFWLPAAPPVLQYRSLFYWAAPTFKYL